MRLENKTILITGGNSGMGFATAQKLIQEGANVIITGSNSEKTKNAAKILGSHAQAMTCDVTDMNAITALFEEIKKNFGELNGLVVNAGQALLDPIEQVTEARFDMAINLNLKGAFFTVQKAIPLFTNGGSIVLNASLSAHRTFQNGAIYAATKAALLSLASSLALELAKYNIRVNSVSPGVVLTPFFNEFGLNEEEMRGFVLQYRKKMSLERMGKPEEIANVIAFLLSEESSFITGTDILADGGIANCLK